MKFYYHGNTKNISSEGGSVVYVVYIAFGKLDEPLYVGRTIDLQRRIGDHRRDKSWFNQTSYLLVADCPTEADQVITEIYYINKLRSLYVQRHLYAECPKLEFTHINFRKIDICKFVHTEHKRLEFSSRLPAREGGSSKKGRSRTPDPDEFVLS